MPRTSGRFLAMETNPRLRSAAALAAFSAVWFASCDQEKGTAPRAVVDNATLQAQVDQIQAKVQSLRGLIFRKPVVTTWIPRGRISALQDSLAQALGYSTDTVGTGAMDEVFQALGYIDSTESVVGSTGDFLDNNVLAFYVRGTNHVWVVDDQSDSPELDITIAHELVHALQDQTFHDSVPDNAELDEATAFQFLEEGEAEYVANLWYLGYSTPELWDANQPNYTASRFATWLRGSGYKTERPVISWPGVSPYMCGVSFVHNVRLNAGWAGVDSLHKHHPRSTTQTLSVAAGGLHRTFVDWDSTYRFPGMADRKSAGQGRLGEIYLDALMSTWGSPLVTGWNGDRFWVWGRGSGRGTAVAGRTSWTSSNPGASGFLAGWGRGMDSLIGGRVPGTSADSLEFRASDSIHFARGVRRGTEVLVAWGDLRKRKLDTLWQNLGSVSVAAGSPFARAIGSSSPAASSSMWKGPRRPSPFQR